MANAFIPLQPLTPQLLHQAMEILPDLLDKHPKQFLPIVVRLTTVLIDTENARFERDLPRLTLDHASEDDSPSQQDVDWPLEDHTYIWRSGGRSDDKKEDLIVLLEKTVTQWVQKQERGKITFAIEMLASRRLVIFPTILIHCLRQDVACWQKELLDLLSRQTLYRRRSCQYEVREALKLVLPHVNDEWLHRWIGVVESARRRAQEFNKNIDDLGFFACCPEDRLPQYIRNALSEARAEGRSFENRPHLRVGGFTARDAFEADLEKIDDIHQRDALRSVRDLNTQSLNNALSETDAAKANRLVSRILSGDFEMKRRHTESPPTSMNQWVESRISEVIGPIDPYNMALRLAAHLIRDNQADEVVKELAERLAEESLSQPVPSSYEDVPPADRLGTIPTDRFSHSIQVLAHLVQLDPTTERHEKYLELMRHRNGEVRWTALRYLPIPKDQLDWYCDVLKERAENEWLACCLDLVCNNLFHLIQCTGTQEFAIETIGILAARLQTDSDDDLQNPNVWLKRLAAFFGSAVSDPDPPKALYNWALACVRGELGHDALMHSVWGAKEGVTTRQGKIGWKSVCELYRTAIEHVEPQEIEDVALWISSPLQDAEKPERFEGLFPVLKILAARANDEILFGLSDHLTPHLQEHPVECLELFEIAMSRDTEQLTKDWHGTGLGFNATASALRELDSYLFYRAHRQRLLDCVERLARIGNPTAQEHLLDFKDAVIDLGEDKRIELRAFITSWSEADIALEANEKERFHHTVDRLTELFCDAVVFRKLDSSACCDKFYGWLLDVSNPAFQLNVPSKFPLIYSFQSIFGEEDVTAALGFLKRFEIYDHSFALLIAFKNDQLLRQQVRASAYKNDFIVLSRDQIRGILAAKSPIQRLTDRILEQIDLVKVSPYRFTGPVSGQVFQGRAEEEKALVENISQSDYALLANRKMGKTSLLNRVAPALSRIPGYQVFYCDLQAVDDYESFFDELTETYPELGEATAKLSEPTPSDFRKTVRAIKESNGNRQMIFIFDEVDELLKFDLQSNEKLFRTFRSLSQRDDVRFAFSGTTMLVRRTRHPDSPLFNFCQPMKIGLLDEKAARQLVTMPMGTLNVTFEKESSITRRILDITACHPNMIQYTCSQLIRRINEKQQRTITETDLDLVITSQEFYDYFEALIWGQATAMEKLIVYLMWNHSEFTRGDVLAAFEQRGLPTENMDASLEILSLYSILTQKNSMYTFTFSEFAKRMKKHEDMEELADDYQQEILRS